MRRTFSFVSLFVLIFSLFSAMGAPAPRAMAADSFDTLREKWRTVLTGGSSADTQDPDIANQIALTVRAVQNQDGTGYWDTLQTGSGGTACGCLWTDLTSTTVSAEIVYQYNRIRAMALAYSTPGSTDPASPAYNPLYGNALLRDDIVQALDWMYENRYNPGQSIYNNWYHWELSGPRNLLDAVTLMYDDLSEAQITNYMNAVNKFSPDPNRAPQNSATATGANRVEKSWVITLRGILIKDSAAVALGRDGLSDQTALPTSTHGANNIFAYVSLGDGMHTDGSFIQHNKHPYIGNYGTTYFQYIVNLAYLLNGSSWEISDPQSANLYQWVYDTYEPAVYNGSLMSMHRGRTIAYSTADDHYYAFAAAQSILLLSTFASGTDAANYRSIVKEWITKDMYRSFISGGNSIFYINLAKELINDSSTPARGELIRNIVFPKSDRVQHLRPGFGFGLAMSSSRIARYESINGDNLRGWHMGDGMTYLYNQDLSQYDDNYWPTVNPYRLAGTTVDTGTLANAIGQSATTTMNWVGGASDGTYGVAGMQLNPYGGKLSGKKSWFMFDDEIVALGTGIKSTSGRTIETIVDNRKLNTAGSNSFAVNGTPQSTSLTLGTRTLTAVDWMHLQGNTSSGSDVGYYFPESPTLKTVRESRDGKWTDIHSSSLETDTKTNRFQTLWFDHGTAAAETGYQYALLPNLSATQTEAYAANPDFTVLENSADAQAVRENQLHLTAVNFWNSASKTIGGITSSSKASVLLKLSPTEAEVTVADPTQANTGTIQLEINQSASGVISADPGITVTQLSPTIKLSVDVNGKQGSSLRAKFDLTPGNPGTLAAPAVTSLSGGDSQTTLSWSPVAGADGYRIRYGSTQGASNSTLDVGPATTGTVTGILNGNSYYYTVTAYNTAGEGPPSPAVHLLNALPDGDTYVRDGSYAAENYGSSATLVVKNSSSGYNRISYLRFGLPLFSAPVSSAKIRLVPTFAGAAGNINAMATTAGNWTETGVAWNSRPASGAAFTEWTGMSAGVPVEIDVTAQVNTALVSGQPLMLAVFSPSNTGSNGDVIYGSRQHALSSARPVLSISR